MDRGKAAEAIQILDTATPYEMGEPFPYELGTMYPTYLRAQAYLLAHNGAAASVECQKILDHPGLTLNYYTGALAHLTMARARLTMLDKDGARKHYQDLLSLWKDADPDVPIVKEARAGAAKLQ